MIPYSMFSRKLRESLRICDVLQVLAMPVKLSLFCSVAPPRQRAHEHRVPTGTPVPIATGERPYTSRAQRTRSGPPSSSVGLR